jgi:hypothetical protein
MTNFLSILERFSNGKYQCLSGKMLSNMYVEAGSFINKLIYYIYTLFSKGKVRLCFAKNESVFGCYTYIKFSNIHKFKKIWL